MPVHQQIMTANDLVSKCNIGSELKSYHSDAQKYNKDQQDIKKQQLIPYSESHLIGVYST